MQAAKCINRNNAVKVCIDSKCEIPNPFICNNCVNSQCNTLHSRCINPDWINIKSKLEQKNILDNTDFVNICNAVEQTIHKSMKYLQKELQYFFVWKSNFGIPIEVLNLFKKISENQEHKLTGRQIEKLLKTETTQKEIKKFDETKTVKQMKQVIKRMSLIQKDIRQIYSVWDGDLQNSKSIKLEILNNNKNQPIKTKKSIKIIRRNQIINEPTNIVNRKTIQINPVELSLKLKQKWLEDLNKKIININEKPIHLELKFWNIKNDHVYHANLNLRQFAESLKKCINLKFLKTLTLYYPWILDSDYTKCYQLISASLMNLKELKLVTMIVHGVQSSEGFEDLGNRVKIEIDQGWFNRQEW